MHVLYNRKLFESILPLIIIIGINLDWSSKKSICIRNLVILAWRIKSFVFDAPQRANQWFLSSIYFKIYLMVQRRAILHLKNQKRKIKSKKEDKENTRNWVLVFSWTLIKFKSILCWCTLYTVAIWGVSFGDSARQDIFLLHQNGNCICFLLSIFKA